MAWHEGRLYAVVLRMIATKAGAVPPSHGDRVQAALYRYIEAGDPELSQRLHDSGEAKPFTVSLLDGGKRGRDQAQHFGEGDEAFWRFTLLSDDLFDTLLSAHLMRDSLPVIRIGAVDFMVTDAYVSGSRPHIHSGSVRLESLIEHYAKADPHALPKTLRLRFASPTVFRQGRSPFGSHRFAMFPEPGLLFGSLRKRWLKLGVPGLGDDFDQWVSDACVPMIYDLKTVAHKDGKKTIPGFTGTVTYRFYDVEWLSFAHLLGQFAFYAGVGSSTGTGMGTVYPLSDQPKGSP